jgi:hypothetical protein
VRRQARVRAAQRVGRRRGAGSVPRFISISHRSSDCESAIANSTFVELSRMQASPVIAAGICPCSSGGALLGSTNESSGTT